MYKLECIDNFILFSKGYYIGFHKGEIYHAIYDENKGNMKVFAGSIFGEEIIVILSSEYRKYFKVSKEGNKNEISYDVPERFKITLTSS